MYAKQKNNGNQAQNLLRGGTNWLLNNLIVYQTKEKYKDFPWNPKVYHTHEEDKAKYFEYRYRLILLELAIKWHQTK